MLLSIYRSVEVYMDMNYSIVAVFDKNSQIMLNKVRKRLNANGIKCDPSISHITLVRYKTNQRELIKEKVKSFSDSFISFEINLNELETFTDNNNTIYLKPSFNNNLFDLHKKIIKYFGDFAKDLNEYYDLENWVPHCTLALRLSEAELYKGVNILKKCLKLPIKVKIEKIDIL